MKGQSWGFAASDPGVCDWEVGVGEGQLTGSSPVSAGLPASSVFSPDALC